MLCKHSPCNRRISRHTFAVCSPYIRRRLICICKLVVAKHSLNIRQAAMNDTKLHIRPVKRVDLPKIYGMLLEKDGIPTYNSMLSCYEYDQEGMLAAVKADGEIVGKDINQITIPVSSWHGLKLCRIIIIAIFVYHGDQSYWFQFEFTIIVLVISFPFIRIPLLWVYDRYKYF